LLPKPLNIPIQPWRREGDYFELEPEHNKTVLKCGTTGQYCMLFNIKFIPFHVYGMFSLSVMSLDIKSSRSPSKEITHKWLLMPWSKNDLFSLPQWTHRKRRRGFWSPSLSSLCFRFLVLCKWSSWACPPPSFAKLGKTSELRNSERASSSGRCKDMHA